MKHAGLIFSLLSLLTACGSASIGDSVGPGTPCEPGNLACLENDLYRCDEAKDWVFAESCTDRDLVCRDGICVDASEVSDGDVENGDLPSYCNTKIPEFVAIEGGAFEMGCPYTEDNQAMCEYAKPYHEVTISSFKIMRSEVTYAMWRSFMGNNPPNYDGCDACPVSYITRSQMIEFCLAIGGRLPSESEWEYAARAGTTTDWYNGNDETKLGEIAWYSGNSDEHSHPICQLEPNAFGLYDMIGNVEEFTVDLWHNSYDGAPNDGNPWLSEKSGQREQEAVVRGGCYTEVLGTDPTAWFRNPASMTDRVELFGFRCAKN